MQREKREVVESWVKTELGVRGTLKGKSSMSNKDRRKELRKINKICSYIPDRKTVAFEYMCSEDGVNDSDLIRKRINKLKLLNEFEIIWGCGYISFVEIRENEKELVIYAIDPWGIEGLYILDKGELK